MIYPFAVVPIEFPPEETDQKSEYLRNIIIFWRRYGALHHDEENSSYIEDAIHGTTLTSCLKEPRFLDFKHKLDTLPSTSTKISLANTVEIREKMENGSKDLTLCFINYEKVLIRKENITFNPKNASGKKYIVKEIDIKETRTHDFSDDYLYNESLTRPRNSALIEKLNPRWSAWLRCIVPAKKGDLLEIALYDPHMDNEATFDGLSWVLQFINENVQYKVQLSLYSIDIKGFSNKLEEQLIKHDKIKKVTLYYGAGNASGTTRFLRVEDTAMKFDHLPSINRPQKVYDETFTRKPDPLKEYKKLEENFRRSTDKYGKPLCKTLVIKGNTS